MNMHCEVCSSKVCCLCPCECTFRGLKLLLGALFCYLIGFWIDENSDYHVMANCYYGEAILLGVFGGVFLLLICKRREIHNNRVLIE